MRFFAGFWEAFLEAGDDADGFGPAGVRLQAGERPSIRAGALLDARVILPHEADDCLYWLMLGYHGGKANPIMQEKV